jgi:hypothetical protein
VTKTWQVLTHADSEALDVAVGTSALPAAIASLPAVILISQ